MANTYTLISSNVLASSAASVTFSAIPSTYTDLVLRSSIRGTIASVSPAFRIRLNGNTGTVYSMTSLSGDGSTANAGQNASQTYIGNNSFSGNASTSNTFGSSEIYIPNYTNATSNKPLSVTALSENNATSASMFYQAALFSSTSAITSVEIYVATSAFAAESSFYLYGIKNS